MTPFAWLVLAHLVGDFVLQNDWMAKGKNKALFTKAGMTHFIIYTLTIAGALLVAGGLSKGGWFLFTSIAVVFFSHWFIDATNLVDSWMAFYGQSQVAIVRLAIDQTLHLIVLAGISQVW
jgi:hypothetical protein